MNIAVIGSGASAYGVLLRLKKILKNNNLKITILSKDLNLMNEVFLKKNFSDLKEMNKNVNKSIYTQIRHNFGFSANEVKIENSDKLFYDIAHSGGLSDIWSGSAALALDQDLKNWGIDKSDIEPSYKTIAENLNLSGEKIESTNQIKNFDVLPSKYINSPPIKKHNLVRHLIDKIRKKKFNNNFQIFTNHVFVDTKKNSETSCINCQSCFSGCPKDSFFRPSKIINEWINKKYFNYENETVDKIEIKNDKYEVSTQSNKKLIFDKIFLCAGAFNSAKIIIKSFGYPPNKFYLYDIPIKHFPIFSLIPMLKTDNNTFGFSSGGGGIISDNNYYHLLFSHVPKEYIQSKIGKNFSSSIVNKILDTFCFSSSIYGSNKDFLSYEITKNLKLISSDKDIEKKIDQNLSSAIKNLKKIFYKNGYLILNSFSFMGKSSSHYSSNLFKAYNVNPGDKGEFNKNLHICDSSSLGTGSSSQPHTFFLMANSYRLTKNSFV